MISWLKKSALCLVVCLWAVSVCARFAHTANTKTSSSLSHYILALVYDKRGEYDLAVDEFKQALSADKDNTIIRLNLAATYIKSSKTDKAIEELRTASVLDTEAIEPHAFLALLYSLQKQEALATGEFEAALKNAAKIQPKNADIYRGLGFIYLEKKDFKAAQEAYTRVVELDEKDSEAFFYLASIKYQLEDRKSAEKELKKAIELNPDFSDALNFLGYMYVEENRNLKSAETMITRALEKQPNNGAYVDSLGWLYFKQGKFAESLKLLEQANSLIEDPEVYDHLGEVSNVLGNRENAGKYWEKSLKLLPDQVLVKEKLKKLESNAGVK